MYGGVSAIELSGLLESSARPCFSIPRRSISASCWLIPARRATPASIMWEVMKGCRSIPTARFIAISIASRQSQNAMREALEGGLIGMKRAV